MTDKPKRYSKFNPRPKPIGYRVEPTRKQFPPHMFDRKNGNKPIPRAMEAYYDFNHRYPVGITPIYQESEVIDK
jgi:hypothetical protein